MNPNENTAEEKSKNRPLVSQLSRRHILVSVGSVSLAGLVQEMDRLAVGQERDTGYGEVGYGSEYGGEI